MSPSAVQVPVSEGVTSCACPPAPARSTVSSFTYSGHQLLGQNFPLGHPADLPNNPPVSPFTSCSFSLPLTWILAGCFEAPQAQVQRSSRLGPRFPLHLQPQPGEQSLHPVQCHPLVLHLDRLSAAGFSSVWQGCSPWGSQDRTLEQAGPLRALPPIPEGTEVPCRTGRGQSHTHT